MSQFDITSYPLRQPIHHFVTINRDIDGYVDTPNGTVHVWSMRYDEAGGITGLRMTYSGQMYSTHINKCYKQRYLITLATRFSEQVVDST